MSCGWTAVQGGVGEIYDTTASVSSPAKHLLQSFYVIGQAGRHDICQKNYATAVLGARILRKKRVNRDISQFATKERKCFKMA